MKTTPSLQLCAYNLRVDCLRATTQAGSGHVTSCLSAADIVSVLFFNTMQYDPDFYANQCNDRFILSKGHAAPLLYAAWKELGKISDKDLLSLRQFGSTLEGHPTPRFAYAEAATGSLGQGLSIGVGMALAAKSDELPFRTYVLLGDSEMTEGSNWEAIELASFYGLNNLIAIIDINRLGQSTQTIEGHDITRYQKKFEAFGWRALAVDGHDIKALVDVFDQAKNESEKPTVVLAKTYKGYGLDAEIEDEQGFHGKAIPKEKLDFYLKKLAERFPEQAKAGQECSHVPAKPVCEKKPTVRTVGAIGAPDYKKGDLIATRQAYGNALVTLGVLDPTMVVLDAEVKNSTFTETFEQAYPDRFYQCFIAEQNMVGMGVGMSARGKTPYVSTFAAFLTRAYDQIRMAAVGSVSLRISGSHAGVSIGQDGPSQMGLEDVAMMRALPESIVLYPCDAVSTHCCVGLMAQYETGISYIRTTRMKTPVIYDNSQHFEIGGCTVLRQSANDAVCIIAAGITVFESLKAHDMLRKEKVAVRVIDCYSVKPLAVAALKKAVRECGGKVIVAEDHYPAGGLGESVAAALCDEIEAFEHCAVTLLPHSGTPEELLAFAGINADAISAAVKRLV